jgi:hypothetical protein
MKAELVMIGKHKNIKVGNIITAYYKGYHIVTKVTTRRGIGDMIQFRKLLDSNMKPISGNKIQECDEHWCTVFNKEELEELRLANITHFNQAFELLLNHLK